MICSPLIGCMLDLKSRLYTILFAMSLLIGFGRYALRGDLLFAMSIPVKKRPSGRLFHVQC